jgi:hypothetical protein
MHRIRFGKRKNLGRTCHGRRRGRKRKAKTGVFASSFLSDIDLFDLCLFDLRPFDLGLFDPGLLDRPPILGSTDLLHSGGYPHPGQHESQQHEPRHQEDEGEKRSLVHRPFLSGIIVR